MARSAVVLAALLYFGLVFGAGFILGPVRMLWLVPRVGVRAAELIEMPVMLTAIYFAARFVVSRCMAGRSPARPVATGLLALALLLAAEVTLGVALTGRSVWQVLIADRDPVSGSAYYAALAVFAALPWWLVRRKVESRPQRVSYRPRGS